MHLEKGNFKVNVQRWNSYFGGEFHCDTLIPGPTRLADPNRVRSARPYTETLYLLYQTLVYPILITISTYHIQKSKIKLPP